MTETSPLKLGFGMMRLPRKGPFIDIPQTSKMVDMFMEAGGTYFDTAYIYPGSEKAVKKALVDRHPRSSFELATKLNVMSGPTESTAKAEFTKSLEKTGAGYFDYYLLHALMDANYRRYEKLHLWDFVKEKKAAGLIRHIGFSFHGGPRLLKQLLQDHPETEFVLLQINYADWDNPKVASRENYETAREAGKTILVMEPVKGGRLANPPASVRKLMEDFDPDASPASWAIRFAASLDGVRTVLSGMSNLEQMRDNLSFMQNFQPLSHEEQQVIQKCQTELGKSAAIPCTACGYCLPECPQKIQIPQVFSAMNKWLAAGQLEDAKAAYNKLRPPASVCLKCAKCEKACPQHLEIVKDLAASAERLEAK